VPIQSCVSFKRWFSGEKGFSICSMGKIISLN
jgi:hypothetical protein